MWHTTQHNTDYIVLGDLTAVYRLPCVLDMKLGMRQWGDDATPKKIEYEKFKVRVLDPQLRRARVWWTRTPD
jgi:hypothetical protein